jgi:predicted ATPase/DNA-binding SARP family transcriptional activator
LKHRKGQWLLALLALRAGREVDRSWLAGLLWPGSTETAALKNLRNSLTDLRRMLGPAAAGLRSPAPRTLSLDLTHVAADIVAFDAAIAAGDDASLQRAVALYRGPLLDGCTEEWAFQERQARERAYLKALETLAASALAGGDPVSAERYLRQAVAVDPLRESAQRELMQALAAGGSCAASLLVYRELRLRLHREVNAEPDGETTALFQQIRAEARQRAEVPLAATDRPPEARPLRSTVPIRHNLACQLTSFVGREREIEAVKRLLDERRLVTLTGAGGCGKTRLALEIAADLVDDLADGVFFVELAPVRDPHRVASAIAQTLGVRETGGVPLLESLQAYLREKHLLLLLDNYEHLLQVAKGGGTAARSGAGPRAAGASAPRRVCEAALLVAELLAAAPGLKVLATSRARLHLRGEKEVSVPPLRLPDPTHLPAFEDLLHYSAVKLFMERVQDMDSGFVLTEANAAAVVEICARLDGLPLAIELAAAHSKLLPPQALLARLERRLPLLTGGARDLPARQQTLRDTIAWSYDLLTEPEKRLFRRLSVFVGGCTLEAAEAVGNGEGDRELAGLEALVRQSLLRAETMGGEPRFWMLETIREFGRDQLEETGETHHVRCLHLNYFLDLAERVEPRLDGPEQAAGLDQLEHELDNLRVALEWCQVIDRGEQAALRLMGATGEFWWIRCRPREGREWLQQFLARDSGAPTPFRAKALGWAATLTTESGRTIAEASVLARECLSIYRHLGDRREVAEALARLGWLTRASDLMEARALHDESLALARELGDEGVLAEVLWHMSYTLLLQRDWRRLETVLAEGLALSQNRGNSLRVAACYRQIGRAALQQGDYTRARDCFLEDLNRSRSHRNMEGVRIALHNLAEIAMRTGDLGEAESLLTQCLEISRDLGLPGRIAFALARLAWVLSAQRRAGPAVRLAAAVQTWHIADGGAGSPETNSLSPLLIYHRGHGSAPADDSACPNNNQILASSQTALGEEAFAAAWAEGQAMTLEQAIEYALAEGELS